MTRGTPVNSLWLERSFFEKDPVSCARGLIGCELVWGRCSGIVIETEAYAECGDEACHTFTRRSAREFMGCHPAGTAYVYLNYGMHWLANVLVKGTVSGFVLLRGLHPTCGLSRMRQRRGRQDAGDLCSGPGKLSMALGITGNDHGGDFCNPGATGKGFRKKWQRVRITSTPRIGISRATTLPWRFVGAVPDHSVATWNPRDQARRR